MFLHEDKELFAEVITNSAVYNNKPVAIVEKDYYVTMILKLLAKKADNIVFKGGTSLSKGFRVLTRFSEDIDITFTEHIGESRRKKLKYDIMKNISEELHMPIINWDSIESDKDYNCYIFGYESINQVEENALLEGVKVETALSSYAFPIENRSIGSDVYSYLVNDNADVIKEYELELFDMKLQTIERTFVDKIFALCDYYLQGKYKRYSRHLYDIYKLYDQIVVDEETKSLVKEVRLHRAKMKICPSAKDSVSIRKVVHEFCENDFYKNDYSEITSYFLNDMVTYEDSVRRLLAIIDSGLFD